MLKKDCQLILNPQTKGAAQALDLASEEMKASLFRVTRPRVQRHGALMLQLVLMYALIFNFAMRITGSVAGALT